MDLAEADVFSERRALLACLATLGLVCLGFLRDGAAMLFSSVRGAIGPCPPTVLQDHLGAFVAICPTCLGWVRDTELTL